MSDMIELQRQWRAFSSDRAKAKHQIQELDAADNEEIARLREQIIKRNVEFTEKWRTRKAELQQRRDEAVMAEMAGPEGRSAQSILQELGSNNTVWIYELRSRVQAMGQLPEQGNVNTYTPSENLHSVPDLPEAEPEPEPLSIPAETRWRHHNHVGVVGWLVSEDGTLIKKYGAAQTEFEGQWFVCDQDRNFMAGNHDLYEATPKAEIGRKLKMLTSLLDDTYTGKIKEVDNQYVA